MMNTEIIAVIFMFLITVLLGIPLGRYIAKVYLSERTFLDPVFGPIDRLIYKFSGIDPNREMTWKENLSALLIINMFWLFLRSEERRVGKEWRSWCVKYDVR